MAGRFRELPFDTETGSQPGEAAARQALVIAGISLAPNTFVVVVNEKPASGTLLAHQLVPSLEPPGRGDRLWPL